MQRIINFINALEADFNQAIKRDHKINADPYDNIARAKVCQKINKFIAKIAIERRT